MSTTTPPTDPADVAQIVAALRQDPILVSTMLGGGDTARTARTLAELRTHSTVPVYVVLTRTPTGITGDHIDEQLVSSVHAGLGRPGVYYVHTSQGDGAVGVYGVYARQTARTAQIDLEGGVYAGEAQIEHALPHTAALGEDPEVAPGADAAVLLDLTARATVPEPYVDGSTTAQTRDLLSTAQVHALTGAPWVEPGYVDTSAAHLQPPSTGLTSLVAVAVGLGVFLLAFRTMRAVSAWRLGAAALPAGGDRPRLVSRTGDTGPTGRSGRRERPSPPDPDDLRAAARSALDDLDHALAGPSAQRADPVHLARAKGGRDAGVALLDSDDVLDLVGARVLALAGSRALARPHAPAYQPCYLDPRHGEATTPTRARRGVDVPTCPACHAAVEAGEAPAPLLDRRGRPYYLGRTVWARTGFGALDDDLWRTVSSDRGGKRGRSR